MQLLVFNTTTKTTKLYDGSGVIISMWDNVPTVRVQQEGFYEVIQKDEFDRSYPVFRCPISNTNMKIEK